MALVLDHPGAAARIAGRGHRRGLARPVHHFGTVEGQCAHGFRILAIAAADRADVADVVGFQHRVKGLDAVAIQLDPAVVDIVRRAGALAAPDVILGGLVHHFAIGSDDEQRVEVAVGHDLRPARLALADDVGVVELRQPAQVFGLLTGDIDEQIARRHHVWQVEDLVGESGERTFGEGDDLHGHVDVDHRNRRVDHLLDVFEVVPDLFSFRDAVDDRRQTDGEVGCNRPGRWGLWHG